MAINIEKLITQIDARYAAIDSNTSALEQFRINQARDRLNNSGVNALTYNSTGQLPSTADSAFLGTIAYVRTDNVFGDSDGAFYVATARDSGWVRIASTQDSDEAAIAAPGGGGGGGGGGSGPTLQTRNVIGSIKGYTLPGVSYPTMNTYSYTSDGNATTLSSFPNFFPGIGSPMYAIASASDETYGYTLGAYTPSSPGVETYTRFPFANEDAATALGMTAAPGRAAGSYFGHGSYSGTHIYIAGGYTGNASNSISKFAVASVPGVTATDVGDLNANRSHGSGLMSSSEDDAYIAAGLNPGYAQGIDKISYTSDGNATDHGDLTVSNTYGHGHTNSETHGYVHGGQSQPTTQNRIEKWPFASSSNSSDVGDLTGVAQYTHGTSSTTHGYRAGGNPNIDIIDKYDFSSDGNATDVGDLQGTNNGYTGGVQN